MNIINEMDLILDDLREGKKVEIEKVEELLNHYCENPIVENGYTTHPFTDPLSAEILNGAFNKEKGIDHPNYIRHQLGIIEGILKDKKILIESGAYEEEYFEKLEKIQERIEEKGLLKADKLGNPVPSDIGKQSQEVAQRYIATLGEQGNGDYIEYDESEK